MSSFDVIIIGRGITGLSAAWHLYRHGIRKICLIAPKISPETTATLGPGYASVSLHDNISRAVHGQGSEVAHAILNLNRTGFSGLLDFARERNIFHQVGQVSRFADSDLEAKEMTKAVAWLVANGFPASIEKNENRLVQRDGAAAASLDISMTLKFLEKESKAAVRSNSVKAIKSNSNGVDVSLEDDTIVSGEMVIAACHSGIKELIPEMEHTLVNHADQWMEFEVTKGTLPLAPGDLTFTAHSHFWMSCATQNTLRAGGARFLRKWAGIEAESAPVMGNITNAVKTKIEELFKSEGVKLSDPVKASGILDIRACDEIPIIGPMFGDSRILLASGYMGSGLTLGFAAGQGLAEFVDAGKSKVIPSLFHPNRLRSLTETD